MGRAGSQRGLHLRTPYALPAAAAPLPVCVSACTLPPGFSPHFRLLTVQARCARIWMVLPVCRLACRGNGRPVGKQQGGRPHPNRPDQLGQLGCPWQQNAQPQPKAGDAASKPPAGHRPQCCLSESPGPCSPIWPASPSAHSQQSPKAVPPPSTPIHTARPSCPPASSRTG